MVALATVEPGHFKRRAQSISGNAKLYSLIEDMAGALDMLVESDKETHIKLDTIIEILGSHGHPEA